MWPVIIRELQAEARHPFTYGMRSLGAGVLSLVGAYFALDTGLVGQRGGPLFAWLHLTLFCSIWMLVPLVAADCISRERREGTLGLLFLTPLIYLGNAFTNSGNREWMLLSICFFAVTFLTLPVVGLYFSLARTNFIIAFVWTFGLGVLAPLLLAGLVSALLGPLLPNLYVRGPASGWDNLVADGPSQVLTLVFQFALAAVLGFQLQGKLVRRGFDFQQGRG